MIRELMMSIYCWLRGEHQGREALCLRCGGINWTELDRRQNEFLRRVAQELQKRIDAGEISLRQGGSFTFTLK